TICSSGRCPNISECWSRRTATFMIGGDICTRSCRFCATSSGRPKELDMSEPLKVARAIRILGLHHAVITSVDRDDLEDGGAGHWVRTVEAVRREAPETTLELLIPDFDAREELLRMIVESGADIVGHNIETVERLTPSSRSRATYRGSLEVLRMLGEMGAQTKSGLMLGLGESEKEVERTLEDLYEVGVRRATIGQYLQPTAKHLSVERYVTPEEFERYATRAREIGYTHIFSAPLVRSSYMAEL
ncbi:MAG: lipoyl synthase, partial [Rikenellaceae bacterium]